MARMRASQRIRGIVEGGDGWAILGLARARRAAGLPVIDLTIGEHDVPTDPTILAAMDASARGGNTGYAAVPGILALRVGDRGARGERTGAPTRPANVLVTPGG